MNFKSVHVCLSLLVALGCLVSGCQEVESPSSGPAAAAVSGASSPDPVASNTSTNGNAATGTSESPPAAASPEPAPRIKDVTFDYLKFKMEKTETFVRSMLTYDVERLHQKPIRIRGYFFPSFQSTLTSFVLTRDNQECCFGPGAALYDCVVVDMKPGKTAEYTTRPVVVEGTFEIRQFDDPDGKAIAIYHLDADSVK